MIELRKHVLFREAEAARMARLFGDTDLGLVFYADGDKALPVSEDERDLFLAQAHRATEAHIADLRRAPVKVLILSIAFYFAFQGVQGLLDWLVPAILKIPAFLAAGPALVIPTIEAALYGRKLKRLRSDLAGRLRLRSEVPPEIALPHRRYNIFAVGSVVAAVLGAGLWLIEAFGDHNGNGTQWVLYLAPAWILHFAGRRVDRVHRRLPERIKRQPWKRSIDPTM